MTLSKMIFKCSKIWSCGQLYSALSRVRDLLQLKVIGDIDENTVCAAPEVIQFENNTKWCVIDHGPG